MLAFGPDQVREMVRKIPHAMVVDLVNENILNTGAGQLINNIATELDKKGY